jgi:hypothetical protein
MTPDPLYQALRMYNDLVEIRRHSTLVEAEKTDPDLTKTSSNNYKKNYEDACWLCCRRRGFCLATLHAGPLRHTQGLVH